ncbi:nitric oxide reductase transcriptional regulator NorR [Sessilibacter corallicola]|uniref:Nitric oxide reductase transcriptional regulator NorR n=1 Tax=Sessilibacter corallicola TaxID=2904075 RepID=A0ABQ0ACE9_9GAMM
MGEIPTARLVELAIDLTRGLTTKNRFERLLETVRQSIECDCVVLLELNGNQLKPLAQQGLMPDSLGRRFNIGDHPRFEQICQSNTPIRFPTDSELPDPYDGLLLTSEEDIHIHACMGLPLLVENKLIGVLTLDSLTPTAFDEISSRTLDILSIMSAATLNTAMLLRKLEDRSVHSQKVVEELTHEALSKDGGELIGESTAMQKLKKDLQLVAPSDFTVLIEGETGVGKELVARTLHQLSSRSQQPLVYVNCAAIPENLIESELFGHVKGAFTGADRTRAGKFSIANKGTIFLDEIGELPLSAQSKLLRVLQNQEIQPVGMDKVEQIDTRILAATNRELANEVELGKFRSDLYHRLSVYPIKIPPLRDRNQDVTLLAGYFCETLRRKLGLRQLSIHSNALRRLQSYRWPGNVRELEHSISRAALLAKGSAKTDIVDIEESHLQYLNNDLNVPVQESADSEKTQIKEEGLNVESLKQATDDFQRQLILDLLNQHDNNWSSVARALNVDRSNLNRLAKRLGIQIKKTVTLRE